MIIYAYLKEEIRKIKLQPPILSADIHGYSFTFVYHDESWYVRTPYGLINLTGSKIDTDKLIAFRDTKNQDIIELYLCDESSAFDNYEIKNIRIGTSSHDDIVLLNDIYAGTIEISYESRTIHCENAYVSFNNERICNDLTFEIGDRLELFGMIMIFAEQFICINGTEKIDIRLKKFRKNIQTAVIPQINETVIRRNKYPNPFSSSIRIQVPESMITDDSSSFLISGGPMIFMACGTIISTLINQNYSRTEFDVIRIISQMLIPIVMIMSVLIFYPLRKMESRHRALRNRKKRNEEYLHKLALQLKDSLQRRITYSDDLNSIYPEIDHLISSYRRGIRYKDRTGLRIGVSAAISNMEITDITSVEICDKDLSDDIHKLIDNFDDDIETPLILDITKQKIVRIAGEKAFQLWRTLLMEAGIYGYRIALITDDTSLLSDRSILELEGLFDSAYERRVFTHDEATDAEIIFTDSLIPHECNCTVITLAECKCDVLIDTSDDSCLNDIENKEIIPFLPEYASARLVPYGNGYVPKNRNLYTLFDMYGIDSVNELDLYATKKEDSLQFMLGIDDKGNRVMFDLTENGSGPHGLIAGVTGSGKSELILTMLTSLMMFYTSEQVQIAIIDFKGGGISGIFSNYDGLPHIAGILSNLDLKEIKRAIIALKHECEYREKQFALLQKETRSIVNHLSTYRRFKVNFPAYPLLTDLVIVVDEFAELKRQYPEFLDELISIARIGRSLGIHLILSTQKPAGIINDQIRSNCNFRISLKVNDVQDSLDVLHVKDAAYLTEKGSFVMVSDHGMIKGKAAYSSYRKPAVDIYCSLVDERCRVIRDNTMHARCERAEIEQVLDKISSFNGLYESARPLWMPILSEVHAHNLKYPDSIGLIDDYLHETYSELRIKKNAKILILNREEKNEGKLMKALIHYLNQNNEKRMIVIHERGQYTELTNAQMNVVDYASADTIMSNYDLIFITDARKMYGQSMSDLKCFMEKSEENHMIVIMMIRHLSDVPYRDLKLFNRRWCMSGETDEISDFFHHVYKEKKDDHYDGIIYDQGFMGFVLSDGT